MADPYYDRNLAVLGGFDLMKNKSYDNFMDAKLGGLLKQIQGTNNIIQENNLMVDAEQNQRELEKAQRKERVNNALNNFSELMAIESARRSGRYGEAMALQQNRDQKKIEEQKRIAEERIINSLNPAQRELYNLRKLGFTDTMLQSLNPKPDSLTTLQKNVATLTEKRKQYAEMSDEEKKSINGKLLAQEISDLAGMGGALKYDAQTAYDKSRGAEAGKQGFDFTDGPLTVGQKSTDEKFATFYVNYIEKGRGAKNIANAERLEDAQFIMKYAAQNGIDISGVPAGIIANRPTLSAFFNPQGVMSQERVASVIQQSLKEILGGQFTEKEGIALIQRGYNPSLSPEENLERLLDLKAQVDQIIESEQASVDYYEKNNTLRGYKGKKYTADDFVRDLRKDYTMDVIDLSDQALEDAYMTANEDSLWIQTLEKEIQRRADKNR